MKMIEDDGVQSSAGVPPAVATAFRRHPADGNNASTRTRKDTTSVVPQLSSPYVGFRLRALCGTTCSIVIAVTLLALVASAWAQSPVISYSISLTSPELHLAEVQITLPAGAATRELQLPVWNALYQIRDFSQYVNWIRAEDPAGKRLELRLLNTSRWEISGASVGATVHYQIYLDSPGPFGAQLNSHHAFLNLAQVLMYPVDARNSPLTLNFSHVPNAWHIAIPLKLADDAYIAENYDRLVDSPVEIGTFQETDFDEAGAHFRVV